MALNFHTSTLSLTLSISCQICLGKVTTRSVFKSLPPVFGETTMVYLHGTNCCHVVTYSNAAVVSYCFFLSFLTLKYLVTNLSVVSVQVRQPVICANHHVFCSSCMEMWLKKASQCPTCRVPITTENPCREIIGE